MHTHTPLISRPLPDRGCVMEWPCLRLTVPAADPQPTLNWPNLSSWDTWTGMWLRHLFCDLTQWTQRHLTLIVVSINYVLVCFKMNVQPPLFFLFHRTVPQLRIIFFMGLSPLTLILENIREYWQMIIEIVSVFPCPLPMCQPLPQKNRKPARRSLFRHFDTANICHIRLINDLYEVLVKKFIFGQLINESMDYFQHFFKHENSYCSHSSRSHYAVCYCGWLWHYVLLQYHLIACQSF